jgi:cell fate regulator YaaT (PSP1 superfamily)
MEEEVLEIKEEDSGVIYTDGYFVTVFFSSSHKSYYFHTYDENLKRNTKVVVETVRGFELGETVKDCLPINELPVEMALKPVVRVATDEDILNHEKNIESAKEASAIIIDSIRKYELPMTLVNVQYTLDASKVIISYVSETRVDFRELLKELASQLKCRIELRQIGTRDRSKVVGGIGICGLPLCCNTFLRNFDGISINMAKNQYLALNIQKLSGHCGKLICCLKYEDEAYLEIKKTLPRIGTRIQYKDQEFKVTSFNVITGVARIENRETIDNISIKELLEIVNKNK